VLREEKPKKRLHSIDIDAVMSAPVARSMRRSASGDASAPPPRTSG